MASSVSLQAERSSIPAEARKVSTVTIHGIRYEVLVLLEDEHGKPMELSAPFDTDTVAKTTRYVENLVHVHQLQQTKTGIASPTEIIEINTKGIQRKDKSEQNHDFLVEPLDAPLAGRLATEFEQQGTTIAASALKAQDIWDHLEKNLLQKAKTMIPPSPPSTTATSDAPTPTATTTRKDPDADDAGSNRTAQGTTATPPAPAAARLANATQAALESDPTWQEDAPDWYERIPTRVLIPIYQNILAGRCGPIEDKVAARLEEGRRKQALGLLVKQETLIPRIIEVLKKRRSETGPALTPLQAQVERIIDFYYQHRRNSQVKRDLLALPKEDKMYECLYEQALAEGLSIDRTAEPDWAEKHFCDNIDRAVQALQRYLFSQ
jgi:hypothetical protein